MSSNSSRLLPLVNRASWSTTNCIDGISRMFWGLKWISAPFSSACFDFFPGSFLSGYQLRIILLILKALIGTEGHT